MNTIERGETFYILSWWQSKFQRNFSYYSNTAGLVAVHGGFII